MLAAVLRSVVPLQTRAVCQQRSAMGKAFKSAGPVQTSDRLSKLRALLAENKLDAWVAPTDDAHSSETWLLVMAVGNIFQGVAIILKKEALLFTDGRYFIQAGAQLDSNWTLMKQGEKDVPTWQDWLATMPEKSRIGVDASTVSISNAKDIIKELSPKSSELIPFVEKNLVDDSWETRPSRPAKPVFLHPQKYAGQSASEKIENIRKEMKTKSAQAVVVTMLDEVAWVLNLRGSDIDYNPIFFSFLLIEESASTLFINESQLTKEISDYLKECKVDIKPYGEISATLKSLGKDRKTLINENASWAIAESLGEGNFEAIPSLVTAAKAIKNEAEVEGFRQCHIRDGSALTAYFAWLEEKLQNGAKISEAQAADKLEEYRSKLDLFKGLSFTTISSTGPNGAIIHYSPDRDECPDIDPNALYLCDSGGQYADGTTDVTRTLHFGTPTEEEKTAFTAVLKGHIALDRAIFPGGTTGLLIDCMARSALWREGLDYRHGTGHGVGSFLNVHEGPQSISYRPASGKAPLQAGMTVSNEPGFYKDGHYGIRIESVLVVKEVQLKNNFGNQGWLGFERFTMTPIQTKLVNKSMLVPDEVQWLNEYHQEVLQKLKPLIQNDSRTLAYLERECRAI